MIILLFQDEDLSEFAVSDEIKPVVTAGYSIASTKTRCRQFASMLNVAVTYACTRQFEVRIQSPHLRVKVRSLGETNELLTMPCFERASLVKWKLPSPYPTTSFGVIMTDGSSTVVIYPNSSLLTLVLKTSITLSAKIRFVSVGGGL